MPRTPLLCHVGATLLCLGACGAPSSLDICHAACDADKRCGNLTDAQAANCHTSCDATKGQLQDRDAANDKDCKNAADVRRQALDCLGRECNKIETCAQAIDTTCIAR